MKSLMRSQVALPSSLNSCGEHIQIANLTWRILTWVRCSYQSNVTKTLIARVVTYYLEQIRLPTQPHLKPDIPATSRVISAATRLRAPEVAPTKETELEEAIIWLAKVLDSVRLRYRKLHRYAKYVVIQVQIRFLSQTDMF